MADSDPSSFSEEIKQALAAGNKIEAIRLYRQQTKVGLAEAKAAVEALDRRMRGVAATNAVNSIDHSEAISMALLAGRKIEAIKLYRQQYKVGLAEAKAAVEAMEIQIGGVMPGASNSAQGRGCLGVVALFVLFVVALWKSLA